MSSSRKKMKLIKNPNTGEKTRSILLCKDTVSGKSYPEEFIVSKVIGEGGSCICYDARCKSDGSSGKLKEFYPADVDSLKQYFPLERDANNQLVPAEEFIQEKKEFLEARENFLKSYYMLRDTIEKNEANKDFKTFIPHFTIYRGCDTDGNVLENSTVYIWTSSPEIETFDLMIKRIRKAPKKTPEHDLFVVLNTILTLTECTQILHEEGLLHLDLKPSNFGVNVRRKSHLTDSVSLFDTNTIYSMRSPFSELSGTEGFLAPEVKYGNADNRSDIYSIGCTLFSAIVINDDIKELGYLNKYYNDIPELVSSSKLIEASETNSNIYLQYELTNILRKCLAVLPDMRYKSCKELIKDLRQAIVYLIPSEYANDALSGQKLVLKKYESALDKKRSKNSLTAFGYHLYKKPLYEFAADSADINVLVLGFGNYSQKFLDRCLQFGQMYDKNLNVTVVSDKVERDKKIYIDNRPLLPEFFNINGQAPENSIYGNINFLNCEFNTQNNRKGVAENKSHIKKILSNNNFHYIFIALREDELNKKIAELCYDSNPVCSVNFAVEDNKYATKAKGNPIWVCEKFEKKSDFKELERMAFNTHLVWKGLNVDFEKEKKEFKDPKDLYYYNSSISNVVSIKYKLYSVNIKTNDLAKAAEEFHKVISSDGYLKEELIAVEHRRWCVEKICEGWRTLTDFDSYEGSDNKIKSQKLHMCLVKSVPERKLKKAFALNRSRWDKATEADMVKFDDLERASVRYHQSLRRKAEEAKKINILSSSYMNQIKKNIANNRMAEVAFYEWLACMNFIWNENINQSKNYGPLKNNFVDSLSGLDKSVEEETKKLVEIIDNKMDIVLKSLKYYDYKQADDALVENIPFILTYRENFHIVVPFSIGTNTEIFGNVAVASVINPDKITYLYYLRKVSDIADFKTAVKYVLNFMKQKHIAIKSKVNFIIAYNNCEEMKSEVSSLNSYLKTDLRKEVKKVKFIAVDSYDEIASSFDKELNSLEDSIDAFEKNETKLSYFLMGSGLYKKYPDYKFDAISKEFYSITDCQFLKYINSSANLRVSDILAMKNSRGIMDSIPEFYNNYASLWKLYRNNTFIWKRMCTLLSSYSEKKDILVTLSLDNPDCTYVKQLFIIPAFAFESVRKIVRYLRDDVSIISDLSKLRGYTSDSYEVTIDTPEKYIPVFKKLFAEPYKLMEPDDIICYEKKGEVIIAFNNLQVTELCTNDFPDFKKQEGQIRTVLSNLSQKNLITNFVYNKPEKKISFTYATPYIKDLLTIEGRILEIYVYHKCVECNQFDDIASSYEIKWNNTQVKSEFDCIVTNGYKCLFIECKTTQNLSQDYYFKLSCLAKAFGINAKAVLVADTQESDDDEKQINAMQKDRGDMLDVISITDSDEIDDIGKTLSLVLDDKY